MPMTLFVVFKAGNLIGIFDDVELAHNAIVTQQADTIQVRDLNTVSNECLGPQTVSRLMIISKSDQVLGVTDNGSVADTLLTSHPGSKCDLFKVVNSGLSGLQALLYQSNTPEFVYVVGMTTIHVTPQHIGVTLYGNEVKRLA